MIQYKRNRNGKPFFLVRNMTEPEKQAYRALNSAIGRCHTPNSGPYKLYGARGISVCDEWREPISGFLAFIRDIGLPPSALHSINRRDPGKNYDKGNCHWADEEQQHRDRRSTVWVHFHGKIYTTTEFSKMSGIPIPLLLKRIELGKKEDELAAPINWRIKKYDVGDGRMLSKAEIAEIVGCSQTCIIMRIKRGITGAALLEPSRNAKSNEGKRDTSISLRRYHGVQRGRPKKNKDNGIITITPENPHPPIADVSS